MYKLFQTAAKGDQSAQEELYFWAYLWPRLTEKLWGDAGYLTPPDSTPTFFDTADLRASLAVVALGPQPEPPDHPALKGPQVNAIKRFHDCLVELSRELEKELPGPK